MPVLNGWHGCIWLSLWILNYFNILIFKPLDYKLRTWRKRAWSPKDQEGWNAGFWDWLDGIEWFKVTFLRSKSSMKSFDISLLAYNEEIIFLGWMMLYIMFPFVVYKYVCLFCPAFLLISNIEPLGNKTDLFLPVFKYCVCVFLLWVQ